MKPLRRFLQRLSVSLFRRRDESRMEAEIEAHLAFETERQIHAGLTPEEARRQAVLRFGAVEAVRESVRDEKGLPLLETLVQDVRYALRRLWKSPAFTFTTVLTLALGIGATTSIFTLVHAVLLKSLAVADPASLYRLGRDSNHCCVWSGFSQDKEFSIVSYELYRHLQGNTRGWAELAAFQSGQASLGVVREGTREAAQSLPGKFVSGNYFRMFGIGAYRGRVLTGSDDRDGAPLAAVMSFRLWQSRYGGSPGIVGSVFNLNGKPFTVVGIAPPGFFGDTLRDSPPDFFLPLLTEPLVQADSSLLRDNRSHWLGLIGRIQPGANILSIQSQMRQQLQSWLASHRGEMNDNERATLPSQTLYLSPGGAGITSMRENYEHWLHILMVVSGLVLAIVCANVANLMLVRGMERRGQVSLNIALGARPSCIVRQALTESLLLSLLGGAAGLAMAYAGTRLILRFAFPSATGEVSIPIDSSPSLPVLAFALCVSVAVGLAFGLAPAWISARVDPIEALRGANRVTRRSGSLSRKLLVVLQAALSLVLLSASGLLTSALRHLETQDFGFNAERRTVVNFDPQLAGYHVQQLPPLYRRLHDSFAALPSVEAVALAAYTPLSGDSWNDGVFIDGHRPPGPKDNTLTSFARVTAGYSEAIGNKVLLGRGIAERDTNNAPHVAVVNQAFVKRFLKGENPLGKRFGRSEPGASRQYEIVGVTKDARYMTYGLDRPVQPLIFLSAEQTDVFPSAAYTTADLRSHFLHDIVVVAKPGATVTESQLQQAMATVNRNMPIDHVVTMRQQVAGQFSRQRLIARLTSFFGVLSLVLASVGLYGVTAYNAGRRTNEIGLRMALGASRGNVIALVLRGAFSSIAIGLLLGVALSFAAGRFLGSLLYGADPYNAAVLAISVLSLGLAAFLASIIPAFRASLISPTQALRAE